MALQSVPSVDRRDYEIRISGVTPSEVESALARSGALTSPPNPVRVKHSKFSTLVLFFQRCDPLFVDKTSFALLEILCPNINEGLLEEFEPDLERAIA
jgi:hypothetical protein